MREILFRGKRVDNEEWVFGYYVYDERTEEHKIFTSEYSERLKLRSLHCHIVHPSSVDQFTGLRDKNGKEIYEGDIVIARERNNLSKKKHKQEVIFYYGCFMLAMLPKKIRLRNLSASFIDNDVEIIDNLYENPELLK